MCLISHRFNSNCIFVVKKLSFQKRKQWVYHHAFVMSAQWQVLDRNPTAFSASASSLGPEWKGCYCFQLCSHGCFLFTTCVVMGTRGCGVKCSHKVGLNSQIIGLVLVIPESFKNISRSASVLMPWSGWIPDSDWLQDACRYYWLFVRTEQSEMMSPIENNLLPAPVEGGQFSCHFYPRCWCCHIGHYHCCSSVVISKGKIVL